MRVVKRIAQGLSLYFSPFSAPCRTVLMTLKAIGIEPAPTGLRKMDVHKKHEHLEPWFVKINHQKIVPTLVDKGFVLWESRAIAKYLVLKYAASDKRNLYPTDFTDQARVDRLLYFDQGTFYQSISDYFIPQAIYKEKPNPVLGAEVERSLELLERSVSKGRYALGGAGGPDHLTIVDFSFLAALSQLEALDYSYERHKNINDYARNLQQELPYYQQCCAEGINLTKEWARSNFRYLPNYAVDSDIPYVDTVVKKAR